MYGTVFLHITTIFNNDGAPVAPQCRPRPDVNIFTNDNITGNYSPRMNKCRFMYDRNKIIELVDHDNKLQQTRQLE